MKEAVLTVKNGGGSQARRVTVKLTDEHLFIRDIEEFQHTLSVGSTTVDSLLYSSVNKSSVLEQASTTISSADSVTQSGLFNSSLHQPGNVGSKDPQSPMMPASDDLTTERVVTIQRQPGGGLGISVKGGAEHGIPVLISRVFPGQAADQTHLLHPGDAILAVNDKRVESMMHDDVVAELRSCGPQVALTVRAFDGASHVLRSTASQSSATPSKSSVSSDQPNSPPGSTKLTPPTTSNTESAKSYNSSFTFPPSPSAHERSASGTSSLKDNYPSFRPDFNESTQLGSSPTKARSREIAIHLPFSRLERYHEGSDVLRSDSFEVIARDGTRSGLITCDDQTELQEWIDAVCKETRQSTIKQADNLNSGEHDNSIKYMSWMSERPGVPLVAQVIWKLRFVAVRGEKIYFFDQPPGSEADWSNCSHAYALHESLCRAHVSPGQLLDSRQFCFSVQYSTNPPIYCSLPTKDEVACFEECVQKTTHEAVYKLQIQSYDCTFEGKTCEFVIHFNHGFRMVDVSNKTSMWEYKFSQLKSSADDGKSEVTFTFQNRSNQQHETQKFNCERAYPLLFCVHAFLAAKLSLVDPMYLEKVTARARHYSPVAASANPALVNGDCPSPPS